MWQGRWFANAVIVIVVISLSSWSEHWFNNFRILTRDDDYPFFSSLTATRSWLSYVLFVSLSFSCLFSFFPLFLHLIIIAVFIHSLELPPTRLCRNIKTSLLLSSSSSSSSFKRFFEDSRKFIHNKGKWVLSRNNEYRADGLIVDELLFANVFRYTTYIYSWNE
jgi:lipopolysaccharide export LptBFGC system permease protein LptF